jgi:hypothetical protein
MLALNIYIYIYINGQQQGSLQPLLAVIKRRPGIGSTSRLSQQHLGRVRFH